MEFNDTVTIKLVPLLEKYGFVIFDQFNNCIHFKSINLEITISYNELDKTCLFAIGKVNDILCPLTDDLIKQVFGLDVKIDQVTKEEFVENISVFLLNGGSTLLNGNEKKVLEVKAMCEKKSAEYTSKLLQAQIFTAADKAWENGKHKEFVTILNQMNRDNLPKSYLLKYDIAIHKLKGYN